MFSVLFSIISQYVILFLELRTCCVTVIDPGTGHPPEWFVGQVDGWAWDSSRSATLSPSSVTDGDTWEPMISVESIKAGEMQVNGWAAAKFDSESVDILVGSSTTNMYYYSEIYLIHFVCLSLGGLCFPISGSFYLR